NSAEARGTTSVAEIVTTDISTDGPDPDPDGDGDPREDSERVPTIVTLSPVVVRVPEGFSPNGDGVNDRLIIENVLDSRVHLELFNRWGNPVYRNPDYTNDWEGKVNQGLKVGEDVPDGTYYYILVLNGNEKYVGFITIKR
ncbi:MAG TPA: gliding motility-associated C-terminal domain-containing protein, partial [Sphingobacteriaceae bacterium]